MKKLRAIASYIVIAQEQVLRHLVSEIRATVKWANTLPSSVFQMTYGSVRCTSR